MKLLRIKAIAKKEIIQIWRDPLSMAMAFLMPVMLLVIFGYAITFDINNVRTVVYDRDQSTLSRELVAEFRESGYFSIVAYVEKYSDIDAYLAAGKAMTAIVIPDTFSRDIHAGRDAQIGVIIDGSDSNTATIAGGYITALSQLYSERLKGVRITPLIEPRTRVWYNPELKSRNFIIPGLIAVIMAVIAALLTSLTIAREWDRGTMEQLIATPVKPSELILGKLLPYFFIGFIDTVGSLLMGTILFDVPLKGSVSLLLSLSGIFLFGSLSFGILISIMGRTQSVASEMALLSTLLPAFLLSGFMFAISNMPEPLQSITYLMPARYFVSILKGVFLKGSSLQILVIEAALLSLYGLAVYSIAAKKFKKRI